MITNMLISAGIGAISVSLLQYGYKLLKHYFRKSAFEIANSDKLTKEKKLDTLKGLLKVANESVQKAKNPDDKQLAQASVDIIQKHIDTVQSQK